MNDSQLQKINSDFSKHIEKFNLSFEQTKAAVVAFSSFFEDKERCCLYFTDEDIKEIVEDTKAWESDFYDTKAAKEEIELLKDWLNDPSNIESKAMDHLQGEILPMLRGELK